MELATFGRALRKNWWLTLAITVIITAATAIISYSITPKYESDVTFFVDTSDATNGTGLQNNQLAVLRVNSYIALVSSLDVAQQIIADKQGGTVNLSTDDVTSELSASTPLNTVQFTVAVTDTSKSRGLLIAQKIQRVFPLIVQRVESSSSKGNTILHVISNARAQNSPVSPRKGLYIGLGFLVGLALGLAVAFVRGILDKSLRTADDVRALKLSPVGDIAYDRSVRNQPLVVPNDPGQAERTEAYRKIRTNLRFMNFESPSRVISISSAIAEEGKSTTAANLAIVLAEADDSVVLIEADLRRPRMSEYLGLEHAIGLTNVLIGDVTLDSALQKWGDSLTVLPCGSLPPNPSELLGSPAMRELIGQLRQRFSTVLIDTPPLVPVTDGALVAAQCDGTLMVVRQGKTSRVLVQAAVDSLKAVDARVLGVVFSMRKRREGGHKGPYATAYASFSGAPAGTAAPATAAHDAPTERIEQVPVAGENSGSGSTRSQSRRR